MEPIAVCLWILVLACATTWLASLITGEHSWVDRIWSLMPVAYVWVFAVAAGLRDARLDTMAVLVALWGARLTFNFARKGGYAPGGEDYRWAVLRGRMSATAFGVFNLFFIVIYQNVLLLLIALPAWTAYEHRTPAGALDAVLALLFVLFLVGETVADQQQWRFQQWKKAETAAGRAPDPRFLQTGLFRFSRHPNFFCEQAQWWIVFAFGCAAAGSVLQWTVAGPLLLTLLFAGSSRFTESISVTRYPEYVEYQRRTSGMVPWLPRGRRDGIVSAPQRRRP